MIFCEQTIVLHNKPTTIAMSNVREQLAHTIDHITLQGSRLHCRTPNQTSTQLLFYSCLAN